MEKKEESDEIEAQLLNLARYESWDKSCEQILAQIRLWAAERDATKWYAEQWKGIQDDN